MGTAMERRGIARMGARVLGFRIAAAVSDALVTVVTARSLGASGRGIYALASFTAAVIASLVGGTTMSLSAEYAHNRAGPGRMYAGAVNASLVGGGVVGVGLLVAALVAGRGEHFLIYPAVIAPMLVLTQLQIGVFQSLGDVVRLSYITLLSSLVPLVAFVIAAVVAPGHVGVALLLWACARGVVPVGMLWWQRRQHRFDFSEMVPMLGRVFKKGMPISAANAIQLLNYRVDLLVVTAMLPLAQVGRYSVAIAMGESLLILTNSVASGAFQRVIRAPDDESVRLLTEVVRHSILLMGVGGMAMVLGGWLLLEPVFGPQFRGVWVPLAVLVPGLVALGAAGPLRLFFLVRKERAREYLIAAAVSMVVNLVLAIALVPPLGLAGAALSTTVSYTLGGVYLFGRFGYEGGVRGLAPYVPRWTDVLRYRELFASLLRRHRKTLSDTSVA